MSDITEINKTMTAEFSGLKVFPETRGEKLVKIVYGDDKRLVTFIKRLGIDQTITNKYELPAAGIHLKNIGTSRSLKDSLELCYHLVVVTDTEEAANQVTEQIISLLSPPLALNQRGGRFALESKYAKVEMYDNHLNCEPLVELGEGRTAYTRRYVLSVITNFGDKPFSEAEKEQREDKPYIYCQEDQECASNSES